jgi:hypothetical protein
MSSTVFSEVPFSFCLFAFVTKFVGLTAVGMEGWCADGSSNSHAWGNPAPGGVTLESDSS